MRTRVPSRDHEIAFGLPALWRRCPRHPQHSDYWQRLLQERYERLQPQELIGGTGRPRAQSSTTEEVWAVQRGQPRLLSKALAASAAPEPVPRAGVPLVPGLPAPVERLPAMAPGERLPGPEPGLVAPVALLGARAQGPERAQALVSVPARAAGPRFQPLAARTWGPRPCART